MLCAYRMRAVVLISFAALAFGCEYESHSFVDLPDEVDLVPDAGTTPTPTPDAARPPDPTDPGPDADTNEPPLPTAPDASPDVIMPVPPRGFGEPCTVDVECTGGICHDFDGTSLCTQPCTDSGSCPEGRTCDEGGFCEMGWGPDSDGWPGGP